MCDPNVFSSFKKSLNELNDISKIENLIKLIKKTRNG